VLRREVLGHAHVQLVVREIAARVDDGPGSAVNDQKLVGLYSLPVFLDEVGEHVAGMVLVAVEFQWHVDGAVRKNTDCTETLLRVLD